LSPEFAIGFFKAYRELNFAYLEINPFVLQGNNVELLDMVAKLDDTAGFMMVDHWGNIEYPTAFGMESKSPEVEAIEEADAKTGAYSGGPTTGETKFYAETILDLMTREKDAQGRDKILIIGGAIANFTDVAKTFTGIIQAFEEYAEKMKETGIKVYVRRGGPNYEKGLKDIKEAADRLEIPIEVYGPETHVTDIVRMALEEK